MTHESEAARDLQHTRELRMRDSVIARMMRSEGLTELRLGRLELDLARAPVLVREDEKGNVIASLQS